MRRPIRRSRMRDALSKTDIPTFSGPRQMADSAAKLKFLQAPGKLPYGRRIYAIGDIHACRDKLRGLQDQIKADLAARPTRSALLLYLGNVINQGPDSAGTLDLLTAEPPDPALSVIGLMGDNERMLLDAIDGERAAATDFLWAGGDRTFASWGVDPALPHEQWADAIPPHYLAWLRSLVLAHEEGTYFFVHAGVRPGVALHEQAREDLLTIRQPFLATEQDFGRIIVHGHSSAPSVHIGLNRIGLDTGAGIGGNLTCAVLEDDVIGLLTA
jgi:serine/threonine protein phosphatase 1